MRLPQPLIKFIYWYCAVACFTVYSHPACATEEIETRHIFVLHSYRSLMPWTQSFDFGLAEFQLQSAGKLQFYTEFMDSDLFDHSSDPYFLAYLRNKYKDIPIDGVIADTGQASSFIDSHGTELFGSAPTVHVDTANELKNPAPQILNLKHHLKDVIAKTATLAFEQNPKAGTALVIGGENPVSNDASTILLEWLEQHSNIKVFKAIDESPENLQRTLASLPNNSVIFYTPIFKDQFGQMHIPREYLITLLQHAQEPVYSFWSMLIGTGIVGGYMLDPATSAKESLEAITDYIETKNFKTDYEMNHYFFDWQALNKFDLTLDKSMEKAVIVNTPTRFYDVFFRQIVYSVLFVVAIILSIALYALRKIMLINGQLRVAEQKFREQAITDPLTGLPNRRCFQMHGKELISLGQRRHEHIGLLYIDLDGFKAINDTVSHQAGDVVLQTIAKRFKKIIREAEKVARLGGDEFAVIIYGYQDTQELETTAWRIIEECTQDIPYQSMQLKIGMSIGISTSDDHGWSYDKMMSDADKAMYRAKKIDGNAVVFAGQEA